MRERPSLFVMLAVLVLASALPLASAYTTQIHAPAVLQNQYTGALTLIKLNVTPGNGKVTVTGPAIIGEDTNASAQTAAQYAAKYLGLNPLKYSFTYDITGTSQNVSGPSAGLAFTLLAVYALENKPLYNNFTATGTINDIGAVGLVGGIYDKAAAAKANGMNYLLVPNASGDTGEEFLYYIAQQTSNLPLVQVSNLTEAVPYGTYAAGRLTPVTETGIPTMYNASSFSTLGNAPLACQQCNTSYFAELSNFTFGFVNDAITNITSNYSVAAQQLSSQLALDREVSAKGYLYTGADLAFIQYPEAFELANSGAYNLSTAVGLVRNVSSYCDSVTPSALTNANYEYVAGGELRQQLANITLQDAYIALNVSGSTDEIISALGQVGTAYAWCSAAQEMYGIASQIGGPQVVTSPTVQQSAREAALNVSTYPGIYSQAAQALSNQSEYAAALYAAAYARAFAPQSSPVNDSASTQAAIARQATNATYGIWPTEFSDSALFYLQQAQSSPASASSDVSSAYTLAALASSLATQNQFIAQNFLPNMVGSTSAMTQLVLQIVQNQTMQITVLSQHVTSLTTTLQFLAVMIVLLLAVMAFLLAREMLHQRASRRALRQQRSARNRPRSRRRTGR